MPPGYYYNWSGQFESEFVPRKRLQIVVRLPSDHLHPALSDLPLLPGGRARFAGRAFALTGGLYLLWLLHYNFSVAVWSDHRALRHRGANHGGDGHYLEEAVERKRRNEGR